MMNKRGLIAGWILLFVVSAGLLFGGSGIDEGQLLRAQVQKIVALLDTIMSTATTINGATIADGTILDDSIDFGDVTGADLTLTDCTAIAASGAVTFSSGTNTLSNLPTSTNGLTAGRLWNDSGDLKIMQ